MPAPASAQALKGEVSTAVENGHARLVFRFEDEIEAKVRLANNILSINFPRPVDISIDRVAAGAPGYLSVARRDPDGKGIRIALARKVTMNTMTAGERLYVDLLPDTWTGMPPGLPREVIEELARRARESERRIRQQRLLAQQNRLAPIPVRVVTQPTFTRYVFDLPELIGVTSDNTRERLTLTFDALLRFDLADAKATLPPALQSIESENDHETVVVRFNFGARVDVRTFREDNSFVVDVESAERPQARPESVRSDELSALAAEQAKKNAPPTDVRPPQTVPAGQQAPPPTAAAPAPAAAPQPVRAPAPQPQPKEAPRTDVRAPVTPPAAPPPAEQPMPPRAEAPAPKAAPQPPAKPALQSAASPADDDAATPPATGDGTVRAALKRNGDAVSLSFPFTAPTPAAVFRRADTVWLVFDTEATVAVAALNGDRKTIRSVSAQTIGDAAVVKVRLERPQLVSVAPDGHGWTITLANEVVEQTRPLAISRNVIGAARSSVIIPFEDVGRLHRIDDTDAGDALFVVTAPAPARGILKAQEFVEFRALPSAHGVALQPIADDVNAELASDRVIVSRPGGLSLSATVSSASGTFHRRQILDAQSWGFDRQANFLARNQELIMAAADAPEPRRPMARCDLARFYLARDMFAEAKAVLDVAIADAPPTVEDSTSMVLRAIANIMIGRSDAALKDLANPFVGNQHDAPLWRAVANARLGKWTDARDGFRTAGAALTTLPLEFQRLIVQDIVRAAIEVGDVTTAGTQLNEFELIGIPRELEPSVSLLAGRLAESLGRNEDALRHYRGAADSWDRRAAAQGRLREVLLQYGRGNQKRAEAIDDLETLTTIWRGDQTEIEAMQLLARLYTEEGRYRDAFNIMRTALRVHPNSDMTRRVQDEAMTTFDSLFLVGKGDAMPAIDALALFYDFRELTPIGRRGDEMIRRLADRLVAVDLLFQASELLQHQVDNRLQGAARAQVAARLAVIYLMDRKADRALKTLHATRMANLNNDLREQRLLLEARALSDLKRHDLAVEVIENIPGREAIRLRSDILWAGRKWAQAAEQVERLLGDRWQEFAPLNDLERTDVMRAAIGYAMGEDAIGLARFRERYAGKMGEGPDARAFELVTAPIGANGTGFNEIAHSLAAVDTLEAFLRDLRARYPETGTMPAGTPAPEQPDPPAQAQPVPTTAAG